MKITTLEQHRQAIEDISNGRDISHGVFKTFDVTKLKNWSFDDAFASIERSINKAVHGFINGTKMGIDTTGLLECIDEATDILINLAIEFNKPPVEFKLAPCKSSPLSEQAKQLQHDYATQKAQRAQKLKDLVAKNRIGFNMF
jgi:hypothetical protein